ncbi:serine/threonine protein kinase, partial [Alishewanella tabrizica]|uniref:serine/threonine protein kinase n=1 Tax=Alishewanella tabrizica TaxID=671278 RepID=UPI001671F40E
EQVVVKEFLPVELAGRHGNTVQPHGTSKQELYGECLRRFMVEGKTLVKLRHPNVVRCRDLFTANGTAYLVMDFEDGLPLDELVSSLEAQGSRYTEQQLLHFLLPLADGLAYIHSQGVLHRDIKPANVFIRRSDGSPVIIDFGAAKQNFALASQSQAPFTEFYAPLEQIEGGGEAKPTVDIHAFGGLMYRLATGQMGPKAEARAMALVYGNPDPLKPATELAKGHYSEQF